MSDFHEKHAYSIVAKHITFKTWEMFSVGGVAFGMVNGLRKVGIRGLVNLRHWGVAPAVATLFGIVVGLPLTEGALNSKKEPPVSDRAFRIMHNRSQNRLDQFALRGAIIGAFVAFGSRIPLRLLLNGTAGGCVAGLLAYKAEAIAAPHRNALGASYPPWKLPFIPLKWQGISEDFSDDFDDVKPKQK